MSEAREVEFRPDYNAFPLWAKDSDGYFDANLESSELVITHLSDDLRQALRTWAQNWAKSEEEPEVDADRGLVQEAAVLADRVRLEFGGAAFVRTWFDPR